MKPRDFVSVDYQLKLKNLRDTLAELLPAFDSLVNAGMPLMDHLDKLKTYLSDVDKLIKVLEIQ